MNKFEDVDVIASLEAIMKQNTAFYQNAVSYTHLTLPTILLV